jgi:hypothetical protein
MTINSLQLAEEDNGESSVSVIAVNNIQENGSSSDDTNNDTEIDTEADSQAPTSFKDINFDEGLSGINIILINLLFIISYLLRYMLFFIEDDNALAAKARASAKNALAQVKKHTKIFDGERKAQHIASGKSSDLSLSNNDCKYFYYLVMTI